MTDAALYIAPFLFNTMIVLFVIGVMLTMTLAIWGGVEYLRQRKS